MMLVCALVFWMTVNVQVGWSASRFNNNAGLCQQGALSRCTDPLKVLTNNRDLGFATNKQELHSLCPRLVEGLHCIDNFTTRCLDAQHREFFHMLYAGTKQVIIDLCQNDDYQKEYLSHASCMRIVQTGYEQCAVQYQTHVRQHNGQNSLATPFDDPLENSKSLCCSFQNYMKCSQSVVEETCGLATATFTRGFLDTMAGPLIQGYCQTHEIASPECDKFNNDSSVSPQASDRNDNIVPEDEESKNISQNGSPSQWTSIYAVLLPVCFLFMIY